MSEPVEAVPTLPIIMEAIPVPAGPGWRDLLPAWAIIWTTEIVLSAVVFLYMHMSGARELPPVLVLVVTLISGMVTLATCWYFLCRRYGRTLVDGFALHAVGMKVLVVAVAVGLSGAWVATLILSSSDPGKSMMSRLIEAPGGLIVIAVLALLLPPVEEIYYRSFIFPVFRDSMGAVASLFIVAIWFMLLHAMQLAGDWVGLPIILVMGFVWTWLRHRTGSLVPGIVCHLTYNATLIAVSILFQS